MEIVWAFIIAPICVIFMLILAVPLAIFYFTYEIISCLVRMVARIANEVAFRTNKAIMHKRIKQLQLDEWKDEV